MITGLQGVKHQNLHADPAAALHQSASSCAFSCRVGNSPISRVTLAAAFHRSREAGAARAKILAERALRKERAEQRAQEDAAAAEARAQARQASQVSREAGGDNFRMGVKSLLQSCCRRVGCSEQALLTCRLCKREQLWLCSTPVCSQQRHLRNAGSCRMRPGRQTGIGECGRLSAGHVPIPLSRLDPCTS